MSNKQDNIPPIGAHYSIARGFLGAFEDAVADGATAMQIFAKSPMQAKLRGIPAHEANVVREYAKRALIRTVVIHASYLINFAKPESERAFSIHSLAEDLTNSETLDGQGTILHMGKSLAYDIRDAEDTFIRNIARVLEKTPKIHSPIIIENTAGQGTEMGSDISSLGIFLRRFHKERRIKVCLDTAHLFGAGYDLHTVDGAEKTVAKIGKEIGFEKILCVHLNDSKKEKGSHVDRHADIGYGEIGSHGLEAFCRALHKKAPQVAFILEVPQEHATYAEQIALVKKWFK